jgi:ankyrin repeat protein
MKGKLHPLSVFLPNPNDPSSSRNVVNNDGLYYSIEYREPDVMCDSEEIEDLASHTVEKVAAKVNRFQYVWTLLSRKYSLTKEEKTAPGILVQEILEDSVDGLHAVSKMTESIKNQAKRSKNDEIEALPNVISSISISSPPHQDPIHPHPSPDLIGTKNFLKMLLSNGLLKPTAGPMLHIAASEGSLTMVQALIESKMFHVDEVRDFRINEWDESYFNAMHVAAAYGHLPIVEWIYSMDKRLLNSITATQRYNMSHLAAHGGLHVLKRIMDWGFKLEKNPKDGRTLAHYAAAGGQVEVLQFLKDQLDFPMNVSISQGMQPIHMAAGEGRLEVLKWFNEQGDIDMTAASGEQKWRIQHFAAYYGHVEVLKWLKTQGFDLKAQASMSTSLIDMAISNGHLEVLKWLKETGWDLNSRGPLGVTPAHIAASTGHLHVLKWLQEIGVNLNVNVKGITPLHSAISSQKKEVVDWLKSQAKKK